jgi:hypothetical protein
MHMHPTISYQLARPGNPSYATTHSRPPLPAPPAARGKGSAGTPRPCSPSWDRPPQRKGVIMATHDNLRAAAAGIGAVSEPDMDGRMSLPKQRLPSLTSLDQVSDQAKLNSCDLDEALYRLAQQYLDEADLAAAVHWCRVTALSEYADAPLRLAEIIASVADEYVRLPGDRMPDRAEMDLVADSARWFVTALAVGYPDAAEYLDAAVTGHDPSRPQVPADETTEPIDEAREPIDEAREPIDGATLADGGCSAGGLTVVMQIPLDQATTHFSGCLSCQEQFIRQSGLPAMGSQAPEVTV